MRRIFRAAAELLPVNRREIQVTPVPGASHVGSLPVVV
jgi:hypothetical protein